MRKTPEQLIRAARRLKMRGFSAEQIADLLDMSERTVFVYVSDITVERGQRPGQRAMTPQMIAVARRRWLEGVKPLAIACDLGVSIKAVRYRCPDLPSQVELRRAA